MANQNSDDVSVISTATNTVTATVPVGDVPGAVVFVVQRGPGQQIGVHERRLADVHQSVVKSQASASRSTTRSTEPGGGSPAGDGETCSTTARDPPLCHARGPGFEPVGPAK
ncbi:MAG TPA: hypothetical protein VNA69_14540 [Thermoanaerobaculia bacterium]|nr:hypothetical protein [Thermoanaerobaculia bacterium]